MDLKDDIRLVQNARRHAFVNEDEYSVGAVIKTKSGRKYTGCNIKINSTINTCAEQVAIEKAISEGEREFEYIVVMGGKKNQEVEKYLPCENCKKILKNFVDENFKIYTIYQNKVEEYSLSEIL